MKFTAINFTCPSCGASQKFSPASGKLTCEFCSTQTSIDESSYVIDEYDFNEAVSKLEEEAKVLKKKVSCKKCGGSFTLTPYSFSSNCPYCSTPAIIDFIQEITPKSLIPFSITRKDAQMRFTKWVGSRWFAPNKFKKYLDGDKKLTGYYLPYWTYDSDTVSPYKGLRGDVYYVTVRRTVTDNNGRSRVVNAREPRIRWTPASGVVHVDFDDVTVGASKTISRAILDSLEPWNTTELKSFDKKYLSGFEAEEYNIALDNGFEFAKAKMSFKIEQKVRQNIGGDQQQIHSVQTQYNDITYKNILLPIWTASFEWNNKKYSYAINAQTGKLVGERPYSMTKIVFAVLTGGGTVGGITYFDQLKEWGTGVMVFG